MCKKESELLKFNKFWRDSGRSPKLKITETRLEKMWALDVVKCSSSGAAARVLAGAHVECRLDGMLWRSLIIDDSKEKEGCC